MSLKNFIVDRVIKQKTKKTRINVRSALLQNLSIFFFRMIPRSTEKY